MSALGPFIVENCITYNSSLLLQITSEWWPKEHWIRWTSSAMICILHLSSMAYFCSLRILGIKGVWIWDNYSLLLKNKKEIDMFKFNCATYDALNAVKIVLQSESERFLFWDFTSFRIYLESFVAYHMPFL